MLVSAPQVHTAVACLSPGPNTMNEGEKGPHLSLKREQVQLSGMFGAGGLPGVPAHQTVWVVPAPHSCCPGEVG